ncbi:MAG: isopentenyl-diphosphate Delta-isomerase [Candidatus Jacksonbacteria bacterium]
MQKVILVNSNDKKVGTLEKLEAHKKGKLHRAFSIFIFNSKRELMLQKRANNKYHCPGLWSNTVCSHPEPDKKIIETVHKRLREEMGFNCDLKKIFSFKYKVKFENKLVENEIDHVFIGTYDRTPKLNPKEASAWKWIKINDLKKDINKNPDKYTYWLKKSFRRAFKYNK